MAGRTIVRSRNPDLRNEPFEVFTRPQRSTAGRLLGLTIRLRAEITVVIVALTAWVLLTNHLPHWAVVTIVGTAIVTTFAIGPSRRYVVYRGIAVLTRHRLRAVCIERRIMNYTGNLPILLWSRPTRIGERVWVLLRAGIDLVDFERNLAYLASGCGARSARAVAIRSFTALVVVDIVRRDPLTSGRPIPSAFTPEPVGRPWPPLRVLAGGQKGA
jgi:hypothetical protein